MKDHHGSKKFFFPSSQRIAFSKGFVYVAKLINFRLLNRHNFPEMLYRLTKVQWLVATPT